MLKSLCLKTNNSNLYNYLLNNFFNMNIDNVYISEHTFKNYNNIIIHYCGNVYSCFYNYVATILSNAIITFSEPKIIKNILNANYFYFSSIEINKIFNMCLEELKSNNEFLNREDLVFESIKEYISNNKILVIDGFINFRIKKYIDLLNNLIDVVVNNYLIQKEYIEFINLLKVYITTKEFNNINLHIIYNAKESIILDENLKPIDSNNSILNAKYLSDITFSSNDYILNTLLSLLPNKIYIHTNSISDDFINTLKLIFDTHIYICNDCDICSIYKYKCNQPI